MSQYLIFTLVQTFFQNRPARDQEEGHHQHSRRHGSQEHRSLLPRDPAATGTQFRSVASYID